MLTLKKRAVVAPHTTRCKWGCGETRFPPPPARGLRFPNPPTGWGYGETRFPPPPARGLRPPRPSRGRRDGETRFPIPLLEGQALPRTGAWEPWFPHTPALAAYVHVRRSCAWRTPPRCICPGSAGVPPASRLRGHGDDPLPDPPPPGAGTRLLPPAGEAGRGAARGARWSRQAASKTASTLTAKAGIKREIACWPRRNTPCSV